MEITNTAYISEPKEIATGIFWVGYADDYRGLHCNPYLVVEGDEAVLIDGGNRDDFSVVMLKILRAGVEPSQITNLIYQHYDPDLCGSLSQLEAIIGNNNLKIISHAENNVFINYYSAKTEKLDFRDLGGSYDFATGRRLDFFATPYCHQPGSFVTYDSQTKTLFSSDLFGSFDNKWSLFLELEPVCRRCRDIDLCLSKLTYCPIKEMVKFHQVIMPSNRALTFALDILEGLEINILAPQHGSLIPNGEDVQALFQHLRAIKNVGIDYLLAGDQK